SSTGPEPGRGRHRPGAGPARARRPRGDGAPGRRPGTPTGAVRPAARLAPMPDEPLLRARSLSVGYGEEPVCAPVDLDVRPGEGVAVIGANGAGKSTFLRTVLGLQEPLGGRV